MKDLLSLLNKQRHVEKAFVAEAAAEPEPSAGWTPAMTMFHLARWRDRLWTTQSDAALTSIIAMWETLGDQPFNWFIAESTGEAILRNSYLHPRIHLAAQFLQWGEGARSQRLIEETVYELRAVEAPTRVLGAAIYNLAAVRAQQLRSDDALNLLEESFAMRGDLRAAAAVDDEFASVRDEPRFRALTATK